MYVYVNKIKIPGQSVSCNKTVSIVKKHLWKVIRVSITWAKFQLVMVDWFHPMTERFKHLKIKYLNEIDVIEKKLRSLVQLAEEL